MNKYFVHDLVNACNNHTKIELNQKTFSLTFPAPCACDLDHRSWTLTLVLNCKAHWDPLYFFIY